MRTTRFLLAFLFISILFGANMAVPVQGQAQHRVTDAMLTQFETLMTQALDSYHVPGGAAAVIQDGTVVYAHGFGVRDTATGDPFTTDTRFRIGSTTKSMTSMLIAMLVDEGRLTWDTPVTSLLPNFQTADAALTARLTVRDLMSMATGLDPNPLGSLDWGAWTVDDLLNAVAQQTIGGEYHQHYAYNNEVYALAAYAGLAADGLPLTVDSYTHLLSDRIFTPVGMTSTIATDDLSLLGDNFSRSYELTLRGGLDQPSPVINAPIGVVAPAGAVWTSLNDMARYVITQMNGGVTPDGTRIVSASALSETWAPGSGVVATSPETGDMFYGMGWVIEPNAAVPMRWHNGGWDGYRTMMAIFPDANAAVITFMNSSVADGLGESLASAFGRILYDQPAGTVTAALPVAALTTQLGSIQQILAAPQVDVQTAAPLLGSYEGGWTVEQHDDGTLWVTRPNFAFSLEPVKPGMGLDGYLIGNGSMLGTPVRFETSGGTVTVIVGSGTSEIRLARVS